MGRKKYDEYSDKQMINSWMKDYSNPDNSVLGPQIPSYDNLWSQAFRGKRIEPELIEKAMLPMRIAGIFARVSAVLLIVLFLIFNKNIIFGVENQLDNISRLGTSFITPFIKMFNSSVFVSVPLTIVFAAIFLYLVFSIFNSLNKRSFGNA